MTQPIRADAAEWHIAHLLLQTQTEAAALMFLRNHRGVTQRVQALRFLLYAKLQH